MKKYVSVFVLLIFVSTLLSAQTRNVGIGTTTPNASALLDLTASDMGLLVPRMTTAQRDAILNPSLGLLIFNTTDNKFQYYYGSWNNTVLTTALLTLNGLSGSIQTLAVGTTGTDFNISSVGTAHTFNIPDASATARGLLTTGTQTIAGAKTLTSSLNFSGITNDIVTGTNENLAIIPNGTGNVGIGTSTPSQKLSIAGTLGLIETGTSPTYYTIFQGGDQTANITYTLPIADGTNGQVLSTNGAGVLSWVTGGGGGGLGGSGTTDYVARWTGTNTLGNSIIRDNGSYAAINTAPSSSQRLLVEGGGSVEAIRGQQWSSDFGYIGGTSYPVYGQKNSSLFGYIGGTDYAVYGSKSSNYGYLGSSNYGVYGANSSGIFAYLGSTTYAVYGQVSSNIYGYLGSYSYGAYGQYNSDKYGYIGSVTYGIYGQFDANHSGTLGSQYEGVYGINSGTGYNEYAVRGSVNGAGSGNRFAVYGSATGTATTNYGIYGSASGATTNWAGYFEGNVKTSGTLTVNAYTLPSTDGTNGQVLKTNGAGILTWGSAGGGSGTLDDGYNNGRTITVDAGAVQLTGSNASDYTLSVTNSSSGGTVFIENTGSGNTLIINDQASDTSPIVIDASGNIGVGNSTPKSKVEITGTIALPIKTVTADYTMTSDDYTVLVNVDVATISLPQASTCTGRIYVIKKIYNGTGIITLDPYSSEEIEQGTTYTALNARWEAAMIQSDGTAWYILSNRN